MVNTPEQLITEELPLDSSSNVQLSSRKRPMNINIPQTRQKSTRLSYSPSESSSSNHIDSLSALPEGVPGLDTPTATGVIYVMDRATKLGYSYGDDTWANFGQGAPEVGQIPDGPPRPTTIKIPEEAMEYAPVAGLQSLRQAVADLYNERYRQGKESKYTWENVAITPGGRSGMTRVASVIGEVNVGYFLPEYTAYESMLGIFRRFLPIPTVTHAKHGYQITPKMLSKEIDDRGLAVIVVSNPSNPTGRCIEALDEWIEIAKAQHTTLVLDEFYSAYIYDDDKEEPDGSSISGAAYVEDVNNDPVIIIDGMTKNFRLPGWRVCWILAPKEVICSMQSAGSFLEGGANHPLQQAALELLEPARVQREFVSLQKHFKKKRDYVLQELKDLGMTVEVLPKATFYIWINLSDLPAPLDHGLSFFEEALKERVIVVPGIFFDVNPGQRRELFSSPYHHYIRFSYGPPMEELKRGLEGIRRLLTKYGVECKNVTAVSSTD